jgi:hypothetical protein
MIVIFLPTDATASPRRHNGIRCSRRDRKQDVVAAGPVSRILSAIADGTAIPLGPASLLGSSGLPGGLARRAGTRRWRTSGFLPIWPCSVWGLPCPTHYCGGGALLPHLFTLTLALPPGRYIFCGTGRHTGLEPRRPDVIRHTALRSSDFPPFPLRGRAAVRSGCLLGHYRTGAEFSGEFRGGAWAAPCSRASARAPNERLLD